MGRTTGKRVSLGQAKPKAFGEVLRDAFIEEFGSGKEFAKAACKSEGRVSQIVNGLGVPDAATLSWVVDTFQSLKLRERVRQAWVREIADSSWNPDELDAENALVEINSLAEQDPRLALRFAEQSRATLEDPKLWQEVSERVVHLRLRLSSPGSAAVVINEMEHRATIRNDSLDLLTSLWMRGNVLRNLENVPAKDLMDAHKKATDFAEDFPPSDSAGRAVWVNRRAQMDRDFALHLLAINERRPVRKEELELALQAVEQSIRDGDDPAFYYMGMEVRARVELALGWIVKAEDTLDEIRTQGLKSGTDVVEKTALTKARIQIARGESDNALDRLVRISSYCFEKSNLHHHRTADQLILRITARL